MLCKRCGREIPNTAVHCAYCGAPTSGNGTQTQQEYTYGSIRSLTPATGGKRFINLIVDGIVMKILSSLVGLAGIGYIVGDYGYASSWLLSWLIIPFAYYFLTELLWTKSPAKFLTKTKVVTESV